MNKIEQIELDIVYFKTVLDEFKVNYLNKYSGQKKAYEDAIKALELALAVETGSSSNTAGSTWQPIENLKDSNLEDFIIANFNDKPAFIARGWKPFDYDGKWLKYTGGNVIGVHNLTHFLALPTPPKEK